MLSATAKKAPANDTLSPSARIVDGILVITLPDAVRPVVWQMELGQTKSSAMEVRELNDGTFMLMLKTPRQDVQDIAAYATKEQAVGALIAISKALQGGNGQVRPLVPLSSQTEALYQVPAVIKPPGNAGKFIRVALFILVVLGLLYVFTRSPGGLPLPSTPASTAGEPLSADDYLQDAP